MLNKSFTFITPTDRPDFSELVAGLASLAWPEFMLHDPVADLLWDYLYTFFPEFQFAVMDSETQKVIALANSLVLHWDGNLIDLPDSGWDWAFSQAVSDYKNGLKPNILCAIQIMIHPDYRGRRLSSKIIFQMRQLGKQKGFNRLIAPVRPNQKCQYPLIDIHQYISWQNHDNLPFDPWLRAHVKIGANIIKPCIHSMEIKGSQTDWERWTGMIFPASGEYVVPGALVPVIMNMDLNEGYYTEPNVWMVHELNDNQTQS